MITFYLLQLFSFPRSSNIILLIGALKIVVILFCLIYAFIKIRPIKNALLLILIQIILVYGSFHLSLWKITGAVYLKHHETQYLEILDVLKNERAFSAIIYRENGDSVKIFSNGKDTPLFSDYDKERIIKFMKEHYFIEFHRTEHGIAFIYHRFIDNMGGVVYCEDPVIKSRIEAYEHDYRSYEKIFGNWYFYSHGG